MEANIGHLPSKFGYKQMQGWKVINRYRVLQVNLHIWPHLTSFDLWPTYVTFWPQNIMEANIGHLPTKFGYKQMQCWKVIQVFVSVTDDGRRTDGRTQFVSLSLPSTSVHAWARQISQSIQFLGEGRLFPPPPPSGSATVSCLLVNSLRAHARKYCIALHGGKARERWHEISPKKYTYSLKIYLIVKVCYNMRYSGWT